MPKTPIKKNKVMQILSSNQVYLILCSSVDGVQSCYADP